MNPFGYKYNATNIKFIVQNASTKFLTIFTTPVAPGAYIDLMLIPGVAEEDIKISLIKGELYFRLRTKDIKVFQSNVNLMSFDPTFTGFLNGNGITVGTGNPFDQSGTDVAGTYNCDLGMPLNSVVYLSAPDTINLAYAAEPITQPVIGVVKERPTSTTALVAYYGELPNQIGLITSATYYLDTTPGQYSATPPSSSGNIVQKLGFAKDSTTLVLFIDRDFVVL